MNLISTGYFREMPDGSPNDLSIKDFINKNTDYPIDKICTYLDSGLPLIVSPGVVRDVIDESMVGSVIVLCKELSPFAEFAFSKYNDRKWLEDSYS